MSDIPYRSAVSLAESIKNKDLSIPELAASFIDRIAEVNPLINAYVYHHPDQVMAQAVRLQSAVDKGETLGPLHGVPYSIKDLTPVAGLPLTLGLIPLKDSVAPTSAPIAERMAAAGGLFLGKTNTPEIGYKGVTDNHLFGPTENPWKLGHITGGSSGGAAAAVGAGLGPLAEGSDGAGSVRIPASCCGVVGLKPTLSRIPQGISPYSNILHHGPLTRTVADAALMLSVTEGTHPADPLSFPRAQVDYAEEIRKDIKGWRVAWSDDLGFGDVDPEISAVCQGAVTDFENLGCRVDRSHPSWPNPEDAMWEGHWVPTYALLKNALSLDTSFVDEELLALTKEGERLSLTAAEAGHAVRAQMWHTTMVWFEDYDLLLSPTICVEPFETGQFTARHLRHKPLRTQLLGWLLTYPFNMLSVLPALSVPCGFTKSGLPVGLQIVGRPYADTAVLRAAANFERAKPWESHKPAMGSG